MKALFTLIIATAFTSWSATAQVAERYLGSSNNFRAIKVSAAIGIGVPLGTPTSAPGTFGMAKAGPVADVSMFYTLSDHLGLTASLRGNVNNFSPLSNSFGNSATANFTVSSGNWRSGSLTIGPFFNLSLSPKVTFIVKGMLGAAMTSSPVLLGTGVQQGPFLGNNITRNDINFAYIVGPGFRFAIGKGSAIAINADYLNYQPQFVQVNYGANSGMMNIAPSTARKGTLNFSIGMVQGF